MSQKSTVLGTAVVVFAVLNVAVRAEVEAPTLAPGFYGGSFLKNRYISIDPTADGANLGKAFAIRVTLKDSLQFADAAGMTWWVAEPDENCLVYLVDDVEERNWDRCPSLHIGDCGIVPVSDYSVTSVDGDGDSPTSLAIQTIRRPGIKFWGDCVGFFTGTEWTPPNRGTNIDDAVVIIKTFQDPIAFNAVPVPVADLHPQVPNRIVSIADVFLCLLAFMGNQYPYGCPDDPCWDNLAAPCP